MAIISHSYSFQTVHWMGASRTTWRTNCHNHCTSWLWRSSHTSHVSGEDFTVQDFTDAGEKTSGPHMGENVRKVLKLLKRRLLNCTQKVRKWNAHISGMTFPSSAGHWSLAYRLFQKVQWNNNGFGTVLLQLNTVIYLCNHHINVTI